jgi:hypothetical protein
MKTQRKPILRAKHGRLERLDITKPPPHIDSDLCWCDPIVELYEDGDQRVLHKEVTWH